MNIAIFGGSFNPVTKAHLKIAKHAFNALNLDKLIFVPNYVSPFKKQAKGLASANDRLEMLQLVLPHKMEVSTFEINRKGVSYTVDTVKYFVNKYPQAKLFILIGTDQLVKLNKWKDVNTITDLAQFAVFKREDSFSKEYLKKYDCKLLDNPVINASATEVRNGNYHLTYPEVNQYIGSHHLYVDDLMISWLDIKRHKHSVAVGKLCLRLAKQVDFDPKRALLAGQLHDITKCKPKEWHREFLEKYIGEEQVDDYQLHSLSGYYWLKEVYKVNDNELCDAVLRHTSLAPNLTMLDKILYAADKLADGRTYPGVQKDRELIFKDFDLGFKNVVYKTWQFLEDNRELDEDTRKIFEKWSK